MNKVKMLSIAIALLSAIALFFVDRRDQNYTRQEITERLDELEQHQQQQVRLLEEPTLGT